MKPTSPNLLTCLRGIGFACAVLLGAACDNSLPCTNESRRTPTGAISWTDGVPRVPDRVFVLFSRDRVAQECEFDPPANTESAISYSCHEGSPGDATLIVLLDQQRWDTPFNVEGDGCHADYQTLDIALDPSSVTLPSFAAEPGNSALDRAGLHPAPAQDSMR